MTARRLEEVRSRLSGFRLDALIVTFLPHVHYLTGFSGSNGVCVVERNDQIFLTDTRYQEQVQFEVRDFKTVVSPGSLFEALKKTKILATRARVGYESNHLTVAELQNLQRLFPQNRLVATASLVEEVASIKDEKEIQRIRKAAALTDRVFGKILEILTDGIREVDVAAEISYLHRKFGADADAFEPIVASGIRGALPHARASKKVIRKGEMVTLDFGCRHEGYHSDLTRTVSIGKPAREMRKIYGVVRDSQCKAIDAAKSGLKARALDAVARRHIASKGYGRYFSHSLGHGLGNQVHEMPRVSRLSKDVLKERNVVTIEPGIYVPNLGGVRIEDDVVIQKLGCEVLTKSPKDLIIL